MGKRNCAVCGKPVEIADVHLRAEEEYARKYHEPERDWYCEGKENRACFEAARRQVQEAETAARQARREAAEQRKAVKQRNGG